MFADPRSYGLESMIMISKLGGTHVQNFVA